MQKKHELQCEYKHKLFLIDSFEVDKSTTAKVYVLDNKRSVKRYCADTGLEFSEALKKFYEEESP